jgi:ATP-dependent DNA helicase DinG
MIGLRDDHDLVPPGPPPSAAPGAAARIFQEGGVLDGALGLEHRPQQTAMALATARAFAGDATLLFEAGTGVGKSLAYLLPGIVHAVQQHRPLIVSTHTIALQEQIETKDLPLCRRVLGADPEFAPYAGFRSCVLVGKSNYLCTSRLAAALADRADFFADEEYGELQRIAAWAETTDTGLRHDLRPPPRAEVWDVVNADSSSCSRKHCDPARCFYQRARARLRASDLIIVNHALLFALINAGGARAQGAGSDARGVLFPDDLVVIDEAHTIPEVATDNFGLRLSSYGVDRLLKHLINPRTRRGLLAKLAGPEALPLVEDALGAARRFFEAVSGTLLQPRMIARLREPSAVEPCLDGPLDALDRLLSRLSDRVDEGRERDELLDQRGRIRAVKSGIAEWLGLGEKTSVYWAERTGRRQTVITLRGAPIDVAPALREHLFGRGSAVVCTSATLAIGGQMEAFARRVGAEEARMVAVASPFDYPRQMRVYVAADVPLPTAGDARLDLEILSDYVRFCTLAVGGGSLVLFTSYADMRAVAQSVAPNLEEHGRPFLMQGEGQSRTELAKEMRRLGNAVLFGTESFWTGIDIPGRALSQVIVTRLPFDPPTHPVLEARADAIREGGGNPFAELTLPEALIKFRQGVGRLIRSTSDRGVITVLDSRVLVKSYGRLFIECLPHPAFTRLTRADRDEAFLPPP